MTANPDLEALRASLLRGLRRELGPSDGDEAFERHILLAVRIHRAAGLNQTVVGEGKGWVQYFEEYFPAERNSAADAWCLWNDWRVGLVKNESPKRRVAVTHGQPKAHWHREGANALCIDLESMWDDFSSSVEQFVARLESDGVRGAEALRRWNERSWTVRPLLVPTTADSPITVYPSFGTSPALSAFSASAMGPIDTKQRG